MISKPFYFAGLMLMGCSRDVLIGVEQLPAGESFQVMLNGTGLSSREFNQWTAFDVGWNTTNQLELWYGNQKCTLDTSSITVPWGLSEYRHLTGWECPGLMGYEMVLVDNIWVGKTEVSVGFWYQLKGEDGEDPCGAKCPKSEVNWNEALEFANQLSIMEGLEQCYSKNDQGEILNLTKCSGYRLPTDEEWGSFASKDSTKSYADSESPTEVGWVKENSGLQRHPSCSLQENGFGLCDITGNVWEMCWDTPEEKPELRRVRGGGFTSTNEVALLSNDVDFPSTLGAPHIGFRLVRSNFMSNH